MTSFFTYSATFVTSFFTHGSFVTVFFTWYFVMVFLNDMVLTAAFDSFSISPLLLCAAGSYGLSTSLQTP